MLTVLNVWDLLPKISCIFCLSIVSGSLRCHTNSVFQNIHLTQVSYLMFSYSVSSLSSFCLLSVLLDDQDRIDLLHSLIKDSKLPKHQRVHTFFVRPILELKKFIVLNVFKRS